MHDIRTEFCAMPQDVWQKARTLHSLHGYDKLMREKIPIEERELPVINQSMISNRLLLNE